MSEREWRSDEGDLFALLDEAGPLSGRKGLLLCCFVARQVAEYASEQAAFCVKELERMELEGSMLQSEMEPLRRSVYETAWAANQTADRPAYWATEAVRTASKVIRNAIVEALAVFRRKSSAEEAAVRKRIAAAIKDMAGRPPPGPRLGLAPLPLALAEVAYESRDFDSLPVLADCLEEAGCLDQGLLLHLRSPSLHFRGCWALDLLLGRE